MSKRPGEDIENEGIPLRHGDRPQTIEEDAMGPFEDEFEDEYESDDSEDDEILEAGVDGRPDEEREAEESAGTIQRLENVLVKLCLTSARGNGHRQPNLHARSK